MRLLKNVPHCKSLSKSICPIPLMERGMRKREYHNGLKGDCLGAIRISFMCAKLSRYPHQHQPRWFFDVTHIIRSCPHIV